MNKINSLKGNVYIAGTETFIPSLVTSGFAADRLYPQHLCSERTNAFAKRVSTNFGIKDRAICIDLDQIPQKILKDKNNHPLKWCVSLIKDLTRSIPIEEIGYLGIAYNTSVHTNNLPNLACQAAMHTGITPEIAPAEFANYGCAGGFFPLEAAIQYCRSNQKAAIVIAFDQCTSRASFCYDPEDEMFKMDLKVNLLFSDGAAGILVIPERLRDSLHKKLPKVQDIITDFKLTDLIHFEDTRFVLGDDVFNEVPPFVADSVIKPILRKHGLSTNDVEEWSIHQGSRDIVMRFGDPQVLGLSEQQLKRSRELFENFGNLSAPSSLLVFDSFFKENNSPKSNTRGMMVSFGAGFYQGSMLYQWD